MGFRDIKATARRGLHDRMKVPAFYFPDRDDADTYQEISVRVHTLNTALGDVQGVSFIYAEKAEPVSKLVFWRDELAEPVRNAIVMISATEGYSIESRDPVDGPTVSTPVTRLLDADLAAYPFPEA